MHLTTVVGFDSAWTDYPTAPGAVCSISLSDANFSEFKPPQLATFDEALAFIRKEQVLHGCCLVAIDQPTIVPNQGGCRPVDRVAGSLISWLGGGVQPANRSKANMFGEDAAIWRFKKELAAIEEPEASRCASSGIHLIEVFPALSLPAFSEEFFGYRKAPKYNPANRKKFQVAHWQSVLDAVKNTANSMGLREVGTWIAKLANNPSPKKSDQDRLDSLICALIGLRWCRGARSESVLIGDIVGGYMVAATSPLSRKRLESAALARNVEIR